LFSKELYCSVSNYFVLRQHLSLEVGAKTIMERNMLDNFKQGDMATVCKYEGPSGWWAEFENGEQWNIGFGHDLIVIQAPAVITHIFMKPKPGVKGISVFDRYASFGEIIDQTKSTLKAIHSPSLDCNALGGAEYYNASRKLDLKRPCGGGTLIAIPRKGNCEGQRLELLFFPDGDDGQHVEVFSAKYFCSEDDIWMIARKLSEAIERGYW